MTDSQSAAGRQDGSLANSGEVRPIWGIYALVGVPGLVVVATLVYSTTTAARIAAKYSALADAAMEIQIQAAVGHLWFEEVVLGDSNEDISVVWSSLDSSADHAQAMLDGGTVGGRRLTALRDPQLRREVTEVLEKLRRFRSVAERRFESGSAAVAGTAIDQEFDAVFRDFLVQAERVETRLQDLTNNALSRFRAVQYGLIALCVVLAIVVAMALEWAQRERERLIADLAAQNTELERFNYTVSHDLRSPLITVQGFLGILKEDLADGDDEAVENDLFRATRAINHMETLLDELLEMSRIGRIVNESVSFDLNEMVDEILELMAVSIGAREAQVDVADNMPRLYGDRARLREVLQNLFENALKYMGDQPSPRISISATRAKDHVLCRVCDNGIGIAPEYHERVFRLFEKLDPNSEGTGIGLSLVRRIIEVHGGRIWVESNGRNPGTCFCFELPAAK